MEERTLFEREEATAQAERALRELREGFEEGRTQLGSTLIFSGAAGTGKTALIEAVRRSALDPKGGFTVVSARGGQLLRESPYTVVRGLLQAELARYGSMERQELFGTWYDLAAPALGLIPSPQGRPLDPLGVRTALSWVVSQLVRTGPLVLTVDDLHWADAESMAWLAEFSQLHLAQLPILLVLAYRPGELPEGARELSASPTARTVKVDPLGQEATLELLRSELGEETEEGFANECWVVTSGNPYELVYLVSRLKDQGLPPTEDTVPRLRGIAASGRGDAIVRTLEQADVDTRRFAQAAAVLDHEDFTVPLAAKLAAVRDGNVDAVVASLRESRILDRKEPPGFVHPTIATAIYQRMSPATKTAMHGAAVQVLKDAGKPLSVMSRHLIETYPEDDPQVVEMLRDAADEHLAMGAPSAAVRCLERALEEPPLNEDYATVRFELGRALLLTNPTATVGHLRAALDTRDGLSADMREEAVLRLGQALAHSGRMEEAVEATAGAMPQFRSDADPGRTVRLQAAYYMWWSFLRDEEEGGNSRRLEEIADGLTGQDAATRAVQVVRAWDMTQRGLDSLQALELAVQGWQENQVGGRLAHGLEWTNTTWGFEIPVLLGLVYAYNDRLDVAGRLFEEAHHAFEVAGWTGGHLGFADFMTGFVLFRQGRLLAAEKQLRAALKRSDRMGQGTPLQWDTVAVLDDRFQGSVVVGG
ncbi:ATP-binding protein, partial [Streptacidiphilus monticola]